jgi:hypothetical protein
MKRSNNWVEELFLREGGEGVKEEMNYRTNKR